MAPGLNFTTNTTCLTTTSKAKLRFLDTTTPAASTTGSTTPTTGAASTPTTTIATNVTYSICPVPNTVCPTDVSGNKVYGDYFNQILTDLKTATGFSTILSIINVQISGAITTVTDSTAPVSTAITVSNISWNASGLVSWTTSYATPLICNYQISSSTAPTFSAIVGCTDSTRCGVAKANASGSSASVNSSSLQALTPGTTYTLYLACKNDVPGSQKQSVVVTAGTYTPPANIPTNSTSSAVVVPGSSSYINSSFILILLCIAFLFN